MSSTALRQISGDALHALAVVLSLPPDSLETTGRHKARPSSNWCAEQEARIPGLPRCLQIPHIPHLSVKVSQVAKRVIIAASGGADTVAAKAASKGIRLDAVLHPCATPTALCQAHRGLHPALVREMFFYLTREVADHADWIRRHPQHDFEDEDSDVCHSRDVHDWGLRMIGISALWCTKHTFRALEKGRQTSVKGIRLPGQPSSPSKSPMSSAASMSTSTSSTKAYTHIRSSMRMPHLQYPCEACILAAVGARSQTLIDLRASMLSRVAEEQHDKQRRDKKKGVSSKKSSKSSKPRDPNLLAFIDTYINIMGKEFGKETAMEIRDRSEALAEMLFSVRVCESRRRRHRARDIKKLKAAGKSTKHVRERLPPRLVTKHGHRLPLPLLPLDCDLWAHYNESVVDEQAPSMGSAHGTNPRASQQGEEEEDEQYYVVQDGEDKDDRDEEEYEEEEEVEPEVPLHHPQPKLPSVMTSDFMAHLGYDEYFSQGQQAQTEAKPTPEWEEDYRRNVLESQTVFESEASARPHEEGDESSYVTISVYTELPASHASTRMTTSGRRTTATAAAGSTTPSRRLSPIPGTPTSSKKAASAVSSVSSRSMSQSLRSVSSVSARSTSTRGLIQLPDRPSAPTPTAEPRSYSPPPSSSVYSQKTIMAAPTKTTKTKPAFSTIYSETSTSSSRASPSPSLRLSRPTASSSSSVSSLAIRRRPVGSTTSSSSSTRSRTTSTTPTPSTLASRMAAARAAAPRTPRTGAAASGPVSTVFVPSTSGRTPASADSYVAIQATLDANRSCTTLAPAPAPSASTRTASTSSKTVWTKTSRSTAPTTTPSLAASTSSTVTGLSRFSQPSMSDYKPSSLAQQSAVPKPLFSGSSKRVPIPAPAPSSSSRALSSRGQTSRAPTSRALTSSSSASTPWHETKVTAKFKTPTETITVYTPKPFIWSQPPPSVVNTANGPRRRADTVYGGHDGDVFDDNASACSITPDDSISVVATKLYEEERDNEARRQYQLQAEYERRRIQRQVMNENQATPTPKGRGAQPPAMSGRNLNHYNPSSSRRPPQAQAPVRGAPLRAPLPLSQRQPHPQAQMAAAPPPPIRLPMRPRMEAQNQNKPLPHTPVDIKGKKSVIQRLPPTSRSHAQAQRMDQMMDRPVSNTTQCTEWPKVL